MSLFVKLFGLRDKEIWKQLCSEIGGKYIEGGTWKSDRVEVKVKWWTITLDTFTGMGWDNSVIYTRMRAPYYNSDGFRFKICRKGIFTGLGKIFSMQSIDTGFKQFDDEFVIHGNDRDKVLQLFNNERTRHLIEIQPDISFQVRDDQEWYNGCLPDGVNELYFQTQEVIRDIGELKILFDLFSEVLNQLYLMGSAKAGTPNVEYI